MKKVFLIFNLFAFLALHAIGQKKSDKVNVLWGPEQEASRKSTLSDIVGYDETGIYALKRKESGMYFSNTSLTLEHYDKKMAPTKSIEVELEAQGKETDFEFIIHIDNVMYLFSSFANQKLKKNFLFAQRINKKTLLPEKEIKQIGEIDYAGKSKHNSGNFQFTTSRDSSKLLIYYNLPYDKGENEKYGFQVLDKNLNQIWDKKVELPYQDQLFEIEGYQIDNQGNVHLLGILFNEKKKEKRLGKPNYKYQILSYYNNGSEFREYSVSIEGKFLTDMEIAVNDRQEIICGGFYSSEGTFSIEGSYFIKINSQTKEIVSKEFQKFSLDFITQNMSEKEERKTKKDAEKGKDIELFKYALDDIILRDDGGALLIGEQYYVREVTTYSTDSKGGQTSHTSYIYHYNDIIVINLSPDGKISWTEKIAKTQISSNDGGFYASYVLFVDKDKLHFVFNDNVNNLTYKGEGKPESFNKGVKSIVTLITLDIQGKQTRESMFAFSDANVLIRPKVCEQISEKELILFGQKNKLHRFAKVTFKEPKQQPAE